MIKDIVKKTMGIIMLICAIALIFDIFLLCKTPFIRQENILVLDQKTTIWRYDLGLYIKTIQNSLADITDLSVDITMPESNEVLVNFANTFIAIANLLTFPLRAIATILKSLFNILGLCPETIEINNRVYEPCFLQKLLVGLSNVKLEFIR